MDGAVSVSPSSFHSWMMCFLFLLDSFVQSWMVCFLLDSFFQLWMVCFLLDSFVQSWMVCFLLLLDSFVQLWMVCFSVSVRVLFNDGCFSVFVFCFC